MLLKGSESQICTALAMVAQLLVETELQHSGQPLASEAPLDSGCTQIKLLIHKAQVGCIIGKAGCVIKATQEATGARIQISAEPLPNSSEKSCTVTGSPLQIKQAVAKILAQCRENVSRQTAGSELNRSE